MGTITLERDATKLSRLRAFVIDVAELIASIRDEAALLDRGSHLLAALLAHDDWLPDAYAEPDPARYRQYLLHCDSQERFSIASFVWAPGQATPIHDHRVWGLVGVLRGAERNQAFERRDDGTIVPTGAPELLRAGEVAVLSPATNDIHRVANALDQVSVSIHVYGANIGAVERATYDAAGQPKRFVSGYANTTLPNLWDCSVS